MAEVQLKNNVSMPMLGLGTTHSGGYSHEAVVHALKNCGYRLIDTARRYGNEEKLRFAIEESGIPREDLFLSTKLWPTDYGFQSAFNAFALSRERLGTEYIDLYLLHWPNCPSSVTDKRRHLEQTWRALEVMVDCELVRAIGVSNFLVDDLESLMETASIIPHVNQFEYHPYLNDCDVVKAFCEENKIQPMGSCPLAKGEILQRPELVQVAQRIGKTPAQVSIRYSIQNDVIAIPKSLRPWRLRENASIFDWHIRDEEMELLRTYNGPSVTCVKRDTIQQKIDDVSIVDGYKLMQSGRFAEASMMEPGPDIHVTCH